MLDIFDATATGYNSTTWKQQCQASVACTSCLYFGYMCGVVQVVNVVRLSLVVLRTVSRAKQRQASMRLAKSQASNKSVQSIASYARVQQRYHYKLHMLVALLLNDITLVLLLFHGQFGQNLESNIQAQLYAYGFVLVSSTSHLSHLAADFNARRMKKAAKAVRNSTQVDNYNEHDDKVVRNERTKYVMLVSSIVVLFHVFWLVFAGLNNNLVRKHCLVSFWVAYLKLTIGKNPINFVRMLQIPTSIPAVIVPLHHVFHFTILFTAVFRMQTFTSEQKIQKESSVKRLRKRFKALLSATLSSSVGMIALHPVFGTMSGWLVLTVANTIITGVLARIHLLRLFSSNSKHRVHALQSSAIRSQNSAATAPNSLKLETPQAGNTQSP